MSIKAMLQKAENWVESKFNALYTSIEPGLTYIEENVPADAIALGEAILVGAEAGTPWAALEGALVTQAETQGIKLVEGAATVALNTAQNNLIAKGTPLAITAPVAAPAATETAAQ